MLKFINWLKISLYETFMIQNTKVRKTIQPSYSIFDNNQVICHNLHIFIKRKSVKLCIYNTPCIQCIIFLSINQSDSQCLHKTLKSQLTYFFFYNNSTNPTIQNLHNTNLYIYEIYIHSLIVLLFLCL